MLDAKSCEHDSKMKSLKKCPFKPGDKVRLAKPYYWLAGAKSLEVSVLDKWGVFPKKNVTYVVSKVTRKEAALTGWWILVDDPEIAGMDASRWRKVKKSGTKAKATISASLPSTAKNPEYKVGDFVVCLEKSTLGIEHSHAQHWPVAGKAYKVLSAKLSQGSQDDWQNRLLVVDVDGAGTIQMGSGWFRPATPLEQDQARFNNPLWKAPFKVGDWVKIRSRHKYNGCEAHFSEHVVGKAAQIIHIERFAACNTRWHVETTLSHSLDSGWYEKVEAPEKLEDKPSVYAVSTSPPFKVGDFVVRLPVATTGTQKPESVTSVWPLTDTVYQVSQIEYRQSWWWIKVYGLAIEMGYVWYRLATGEEVEAHINSLKVHKLNESKPPFKVGDYVIRLKIYPGGSVLSPSLGQPSVGSLSRVNKVYPAAKAVTGWYVDVDNYPDSHLDSGWYLKVEDPMPTLQCVNCFKCPAGMEFKKLEKPLMTIHPLTGRIVVLATHKGTCPRQFQEVYVYKE